MGAGPAQTTKAVSDTHSSFEIVLIDGPRLFPIDGGPLGFAEYGTAMAPSIVVLEAGGPARPPASLAKRFHRPS